MSRQVFLDGRPLHIFPCNADKTPACQHGFKDAVADAPSIAKLWARYRGPLVGVATGAVGGISVIDIDPNGESWFHSHRDQLPATRTHKTRREGWHLIYRHTPGLRSSTGKLARGVDIKADGGYIIWWPAALGRVLCDGPIAPFPQSIIGALAGIGANSSLDPGCHSTKVRPRGNGPQLANRLPRDLYFKAVHLCPLGPVVTLHHQRHICGILGIAAHAVEGSRNDKLNIAAFAMRELIGAGVISRETAETLLFAAAVSCGLVASDGSPRAALATIRSGLGPTPVIGGPCFSLTGTEEGVP